VILNVSMGSPRLPVFLTLRCGHTRVLTKDLLRVSRAGGGYHLQFADADAERLAARVLGVYQGHVGESRETLETALAALERAADDFKLVRGLSKLIEREATFETQASVDPVRARRRVFEAAENIGVVTETERERALSEAAGHFGTDAAALADALYADRESRQMLTKVDSRWGPAELRIQYNLSLAQTALFDATEVRVRSSDPKALVSAVKRLRLMYEIRRTDNGRETVVTGPDALFSNTRRYGTRFARLLRTVAAASDWDLTATIDDRGTERELTLSDGDVSVPGVEPVTEVSYDSGVEADFAGRFAALDLDWDLIREPEPLAAGEHVVIPDFAFEWRPGADTGVRDTGHGEEDSDRATDAAPRRIFFEIMGFWTPAYIETKLARLGDVEDVELLVAVDESLGVGEDIEATDNRAIPYSGSVRVKDVRDALRPYEERLVHESAADIPDELRPDADVISLADLAAEYGVSEEALEGVAFPAHERVGRTLVDPSVLEELAAEIQVGMDYQTATDRLADYGIEDDSAVLARLGYRVAWEGLGEGTLRQRE
jgi:predicted nuclease of restriction endonuclease-like RecB superfamily